jgi:hypothetical protein
VGVCASVVAVADAYSFVCWRLTREDAEELIEFMQGCASGARWCERAIPGLCLHERSLDLAQGDGVER